MRDSVVTILRMAKQKNSLLINSKKARVSCGFAKFQTIPETKGRLTLISLHGRKPKQVGLELSGVHSAVKLPNMHEIIRFDDITQEGETGNVQLK